MDINVFLENVLAKMRQDIKYKEYVYDVMSEYSDKDECKSKGCPYSGYLKAETLNLLLESDHQKIGLELANWALTIFAGPSTIDRKAFRTIMRLRGNIGRSMRMTLPHIPLAFYQMYELSKTNEGGMALNILLPIMCKSDIFTNDDIIVVLENSKASSSMKKLAFSYTKQLLGATEKVSFLEKYCLDNC